MVLQQLSIQLGPGNEKGVPLKLYPFQEEGAKFLAERKSALLADEMGLGKTIQAIIACNHLRANRLLIVCPASVKFNWAREISRWSGREYNIDVVCGRYTRIRENADVVIINYDLLLTRAMQEQIKNRIFSVGIFDEAHYLKTPDAQRTQAVLLRGGVASRCVFKWFLTGTPVLNRPVELFPLLKAAAPDIIKPYSNYNAFGKRWCGGHYRQNNFGGEWWDKGATNIEELNERLTKSGFMLRRLKDEVLDELPDKQFQILPVSTEGVKDTKALKWLKSDARRVDLGGMEPGELARVRHSITQAKLPLIIEHIRTVLEAENKLVVFAYHRDILERLEREFREVGTVLIYGGVTAKQRSESVDRFQRDPNCRLFLGQITAAGQGITLTSARTAVFAEISWTPGEVLQAVDRIHRIGQTHGVLIQFLVYQDTLEEFMLRTIIDKKQTIENIVERKGEEQTPNVESLFT